MREESSHGINSGGKKTCLLYPAASQTNSEPNNAIYIVNLKELSSGLPNLFLRLPRFGMNNLKTVLQQLKSDRIKERQEGLSSIRTVFAQDKVVANFHIDRNGNGDPRAWLSVFQALFHAVLNEKLACTKKTTSKSAGSTATAQRRLAEAASAVRWLTERTAHLMNKRVAKALFEHLLQTMVHKGELLTPVALDYVKALRCLVSWTPHVEHMDEDSWVRMVEMAFNVVLGDPVRASFQDDRSDQGDGDAGSCSDVAEDSEYFVEDLDEDENNQDKLPSMSTHAQSRKRRRREQSATPRSSKRKSQMKLKHTYRQAQVSLEQVEFTSLLHILLRSSSAPILSPSYPHLASSILVRLQRFLDLYPADTSLHHDYLLAVSSSLSHLSLNRKKDVQNFARGTWDGLVGLWGTKNKRMKEGLVAVLRVLFPFVTADDDISLATTTAPAYSWADGIGRLWHLLDGEADSRWGADGLLLDSLRLEVVAPGEWEEDAELAGERAFVARTYRAGWNFEPGQALAWAILELQADCAEKVLFIELFLKHYLTKITLVFEALPLLRVRARVHPRDRSQRRQTFAVGKSHNCTALFYSNASTISCTRIPPPDPSLLHRPSLVHLARYTPAGCYQYITPVCLV